ncbi:hypothetical protein DH2020_005574 [Rehmannia glutinosa]|uniref:Uncharacterized protein n=1 Tax=Rehmannia glutinosa TaxID=99300 RepID=A0ABR0XGE0_REHGL
MAEYQDNWSKLHSISSLGKRDSIDSTVEADGRDEEFYEEIEAPKFVDFTVPDHYCPDDRYWFCHRVGCDLKHEEEMDSEAIYKNFVLRVMAARSPNIRLRKALDRNARTPVKCPLSAPPKSSRPRLSRMAIISSISKKMTDDKKRVVRPLLKPKSTTTPVTKTKPVAAKYLTTPRNKNCTQNQNSFRSVQNPKPTNIEVSKSRIVAKALVFRSPKKTIKVKTSVELPTPITKLCEGMNKLEISSQRKLASGYSSKISKISSSSSKTCTNQEAKYGRCIKSKIKGKLSQQASKKLMGDDHADKLKNEESIDIKQQSDQNVAEEFEPQKSTHEEASPVDSKTEGNCLDLKRCNNSSEGNENGSIENCGEPVDNLNANNTSEGERNGHEFMDGDDKENAAASDENRMHNKNMKQNGRKIFGMHDQCGQVKKKVMKESVNSPSPVMKLKKPKATNPKPFRLRTDERGILKEANLERRTTDHVAPPSESATLSTLGGKLQRKQGNDIQGLKIPKGQEKSKAASSVTTTPESKKHQERKVITSCSPIESTAIQRLEKFRKIKSPLQKHSIKPHGLVSTKKEMSSFLVPGQKLDVIHEASPEVSEVKRAGKTTGNAPLTDDAAACAASQSSSRGRRPITVATEPNFHSTHLTRTCTKKLK